jgi:predicted nucleic acid-binding protein
VSSLILDSGALIALERQDREATARLKTARADGIRVATSPVAIAQAWRGSGVRNARLAVLLRGTAVPTIDRVVGRSAGELLGRARGHDVADALVVLVAAEGDAIMTSDPDDIRRLVDATGLRVRIIPC